LDSGHFILAHNHPSGDLSPSPEYIQATDTLKKAGKLLDIEVFDHVIVGEDGAFVSLKALGKL
jgi:DNA repair protein RadC